MKRSLRAMVFQYMLAVIVVTAFIRFAVWIGYQAYEVKLGHVVFHEQISEFLLLLLVEVIALAVLGFMLWKVSRRLLSPLRSVANAAQLISQGRLDKRIRTRHLPPGELLDIAEGLNASFDRYQEAIDRMSRFSSAASHQLRTPLTAMQGAAEVALAKGAGHEEALVSMLDGIKHLTRLTEQLLMLSRMDKEHVQENFVDTDLSAAVEATLDLFGPVMDKLGLNVAVDLADRCQFTGDPVLVNEALVNLVDNSIKVSPPGGALSVRTFHHHGQACFSVADSGPGLPKSRDNNLFERFSRAPDAGYKGSGLGLSIVEEVMKLHGGTVNAFNQDAGGALFRLCFPSSP